MKVKILFAQRVCGYPGQYAPEVLAAIDEYGDEENPDYIVDTLKENELTEDFTSLAIIAIEIPDAHINKRLNPTDEIVKVKVVE